MPQDGPCAGSKAIGFQATGFTDLGVRARAHPVYV